MATYDLASQTARYDQARAVARWDVRNRHPLTHHHNHHQENTMANDTPITIIGNLTADPELRFTPSGAPVASFTIASTPRTFDRQANQWKDGETLFMRCSIWRDAAENVAESLAKGMRVIAQGRLVQRQYTTRDGDQRTVVELQVDEVGPSLRRAKATVTRSAGTPGGGQQGGGRQQQAPAQSTWEAAQSGSAQDPWATGTAF